MRWVWIIIPLILFGIVGFSESFAQESKFIDSPRHQLESGIAPENIQCREDRILVLRTNGQPACVKPDTAEKLIQRGWAINEESREINQLEQNIQNQIIQTIPASSRTVVNFYVNDDDLNTNPNGVDMVSTSGLIEITINGVMIDAPEKMIETSPNSGKFFLKIELPETINGKPLDQNDIFLIKYIDELDASGEKRIIVESFPLTPYLTNGVTEKSTDKEIMDAAF